jgi:Phosphotransferase system mannitol/fructose-specific IIA domain (Ntr-type)
LIKAISESATPDHKTRKVLQTALIEREKLGSTVLQGEGIVLIHGKTSVIKNMSFTIWRLEKPLYVDLDKRREKIIAAVVILIPTEISKEQVETMSVLSKALIEETEFIDFIKTADEVKLFDYVKTIMHKWLSKQLKAGGVL